MFFCVGESTAGKAEKRKRREKKKQETKRERRKTLVQPLKTDKIEGS